jgi:hypothetical protein
LAVGGGIVRIVELERFHLTRYLMETLTPELKRAVDKAGTSPVRLTDPETHRSYVLVSAELYERLLEKDDRREQEAFLHASKKNAKSRLMEDA